MNPIRSSLFCLFLFLSPALRAQDAPAHEPAADLAVLYAGDLETERAEHWIAFLEQWFPDVAAISLNELDQDSAAAYDVVVADWRSRYANGSYASDSSPSANLPPGFDRPILMIGAVGSEISRDPAFNWL